MGRAQPASLPVEPAPGARRTARARDSASGGRTEARNDLPWESTDSIVQGTNEGPDATRARGARLGRPPAMTEEQVRHARDLLARPENTVISIAKLLGVSRNTIYNYVPELKGGRLALAETTNTAELPRPSRSED
ncbi:helix-turn-helix domain-containing protein [Streptomyces sp. NPDC006641]|uniref:helix-turn-helix domain-containing protein n=1 Tax=unclassified Streptomyces TaxID=2593676 RepID=UPI0036C4FE8D